MTEPIAIEVAYAAPAAQKIVALQVAAGTTALQAAEQSGLLTAFAVDVATLKLGVFGKAVPPGQVLRAGDRVEIYRPLLADPKEVRRRRAKAGKA
ncbi:MULTISPECIES: RnfH family protein [unclassified Paludibacterium]|uniref:RnfH family protein n=1 Tax=unclassified Paludibacterium TaxID=2618429 RepID=UPI001C03EC6D|nr:RnfH family protein [Paludibacterium sp. B53371]